MGIEERYRPTRWATSVPAVAATRPTSKPDCAYRAETAIDRLDRRGIQIDASRERLGTLVSQQAQNCSFLVVAHEDSPLSQHFDWLGQCSRLCVTMDDLSVAEQFVAAHTDAPFLLIVDIDMFPNLSTAIDRMIAFRMRTPNVAVVIASAEISGHDFSVERAPVADVSLKLPVPRAALGLGLGVALTNMAARPAFHFPG
jgi:hypothetical protein